MIHVQSLLIVLATAYLLFLAGPPLLWAEDETSYGMLVSPAGNVGIAGSVVAEKQQPGAIPLSLGQALQLGLSNNLGLLLRQENVKSARGQQWNELRKLLPHLNSEGSVHRLQESLAITGISLPNVPAVVGPFTYYDLRVTLSQRLFDLEAIKRYSATRYIKAAAELSEQDARELVVVAVGATYLQTLAAQARVETVRAQVTTAETILKRAVELHREGVSPGIDELRARVELLTRNQQMILAENNLAKEKLNLLRLIGLPVGQEIQLTDTAHYQPLLSADLDILVSRALNARRDYRAAVILVEAALASDQAARAQRLPSLFLDADYGVTGLNPSQMEATYHVVGSIKFPIFQGGKVHGDVLNSEALLKQRQDERDDLRSRIEYEIRTALLDLQAAARQVDVAKNTVELAELALSQVQERFSAGINDNLEVVQAQQSVAAGHEALISALYQHNLAKLLLARATGTAEERAITGGAGDDR